MLYKYHAYPKTGHFAIASIVFVSFAISAIFYFVIYSLFIGPLFFGAFSDITMMDLRLGYSLLLRHRALARSFSGVSASIPRPLHSRMFLSIIQPYYQKSNLYFRQQLT